MEIKDIEASKPEVFASSAPSFPVSSVKRDCSLRRLKAQK